MFRYHWFALAIPTWILLGLIANVHAQPPQTVGLFLNAPGSFDGYTLIQSRYYPETYLIDNDGLLVRSWAHPSVGGTAYLLENGHMLRGTVTGTMEEYDWEGNLVWGFAYNELPVYFHHDVEPLPNGNLLVLAWEIVSGAEAIANGRDPSLLIHGELWPEHIVEVQPAGADSGVIVWEWHVWDHLVQDFDSTKANFGVVGDHPELVNLNFMDTGGHDWLHANAIDYNEDLDQIVISLNQFREFWIIDHSTTTAEAAGHTGGLRGMGGDILYRWGNPQAYDRGTAQDQKFFRQHDTQWIPDGYPGAGNILVFNNGNGRPEGTYSTVEEVQTTVDSSGSYPAPVAPNPHGPSEATWVYTATPPDSLYGVNASGCQRLPNGNTLMIESPIGTLREIDSSNQEVWKYIFPVDENGPMIQGSPAVANRAFRTFRYAPDYAGFDGRDLTPGDPIEIDPTVVRIARPKDLFALRSNCPNPFSDRTSLRWSLSRNAHVLATVHDIAGRRVATLWDGRLEAGTHTRSWNAEGLPAGVYALVLRSGDVTESRKIVVLR